jgi:sugar lactone lactonase YvrE
MAARADGDLVVCGKVEGDGGEMPGVLWRVTRTGEKSILVGPGAIAFKLTNFVAVAPDDSLVFSDSGAHRLYRANGDGSGVELVTDAISYPNGLTFSADGKTLYVASWNGKKVWALPFGTDGKYGAPEAFSTDLDNVDGLATYANGDLLYIASADGLVRYGLDKTKSTLVPAATFGLPANGAFGAGAYGEGWVYVTNLIGNKLWRAFVGEKGAPLPAR